MLSRLTAALVIASLFPALAPVAALAEAVTEAAEAQVGALARVMLIPETLDVLREEGIDYALSLDKDLFDGSGGAAWRDRAEALNDRDLMQRRFDRAFAEAVAGDEEMVGAAIAFFDTERGKRLLSLEIEARRALLDDAVEDAARARVEAMAAARDPRLDLLRRFAEANDLIEMNVQGALNANLAFYRGLAAGGGGVTHLSEEDMLADVWSQEAEVRKETQAWLFPFLALAYASLSDDELEAYVSFSGTPAGQRLNGALFAGFDALFNAQSYDLGKAAAQMLAGQDL